ncbi:MAG TPA: tetratricopeptide repeat protein, partial [Micavibrio sp.]
RILMPNTVTKDKNGQVQDLLTLAKISIANDRGQEALGFLNYASDELPELTDGAEFRALRGAAYALAGKFELAMQDFLSPDLKDYTEIGYWRAYTLAWLEDWQQAKAAMPVDYSVLVGYPKALLEKLGIKLAEVALRSGDVASAEKILAVLAKDRDTLKPWTLTGMDYLKGEAHRQSGEFDSAIALWEPLSKGKDDFYRARAGLALTMLQLQQGKTERKDAIDRLEGLRYAWRGDELESQINFMLGKLYLEDRQYLKGFGILRDAAGMSPDSDINHEIVSFMADSFKNLLMEDEELSPLDAVAVYEQFGNLTPPGDEGNKLVQKLAERVVEADLLTRAAGILQGQVDSRLQGMEKARIATRLAAIYLLDKSPQKAIAAIDAAKPIYEQDGTPESQKALKNLELMRARGLSQMDQTEEALALLAKFDPTPDVNRLRADIAWQAGLWEDAAEALQDLILDEALDLGRPLTQQQADLILNRSVALNLSGNRVALANMRQRYEESMKKTPRARLFDVVTRPRQSTLLSDRQTLDSLVSEVDIFKDFLDAYRTSGDPAPSN